MNELKVFEFEAQTVRTQTANGETWFCLCDVAKVLGMEENRHLKDTLSVKGVNTIHTPTKGGLQAILYVNESNLYKVIFQSRKPEAEKFTEWVTGTVLPSIRKTGKYNLTGEKLLAAALIEAHKVMEEQKPKVEYFDKFISTDTTYSLTDALRALGLQPNITMAKMREDGILNSKNIAYTEYIQAGYFVIKDVVINGESVFDRTQTRVTPEGKVWLSKKYSAKLLTKTK